MKFCLQLLLLVLTTSAAIRVASTCTSPWYESSCGGGKCCAYGQACLPATDGSYSVFHCACPAPYYSYNGPDGQNGASCGQCGYVCSAGLACISSPIYNSSNINGLQCQPCPAGLVLQGGSCQVDDSYLNDSTCRGACTRFNERCNPVENGANIYKCSCSGIDVPNSNTSCGQCGMTCLSGTSCANHPLYNGSNYNGLQCQCPSGTLNDNFNCGQCGKKCESQQVCLSDHLVSGFRCVCQQGTLNDDSNCGACNNPCPNKLHCINGKCGCGSLNSQENCGACGNTCDHQQQCIGQKCTCPSGTLNDANNCGKCGSKCSSTTYSSDGVGSVTVGYSKCVLSGGSWVCACSDGGFYGSNPNCSKCGDSCRATCVKSGSAYGCAG